jgi:hypothetical protein
MKTETKIKLMIWAILLLAVMNISTILTILYNRNQADKLLNIPEQKLSENASAKFSGRYFRDHLGFNQQQMSRFVEVNPVFRRRVMGINTELADLRRRMLLEMSTGSSDTSRLNQLCDSIGHVHANLKKYTYQYYLDIKNICDKQQKVKLEQMFDEMFAGEMPAGHHGKGGPMGRRNGRNLNN